MRELYSRIRQGRPNCFLRVFELPGLPSERLCNDRFRGLPSPRSWLSEAASSGICADSDFVLPLMQAMDKHNIGIVGLGWPGERHTEGIQDCGLGHLYAACDLNEDRRQKFVAKYSPRKVFCNYDEMLSDSGLEAVVVSLPNSLHYPATLKALEAGKHVLCEKPPTLNAEQMRHLHTEAENRGLVYFFG